MPESNKLPYIGIFAAIILYIGYIMYIHFIYDPWAVEFLSHKSDLKKPVDVPVWLTVKNVHVAFACVALVAGAANFSRNILAKYRLFHKINGYLYVTAVVAVDVTSGYMAPFSTGGKLNSIAFNMLNILWLGMTIAAIVQIKKKRIDKHRKWMIRSYAYCFTNLFIHLMAFVLHKGFGFAYASGYTFGVYGAILLLPLLAEVIITMKKRPIAP